MRGLTAILRHEVAERRLLLLAGPLLGLLPFLMPLLPGAAAREGGHGTSRCLPGQVGGTGQRGASKFLCGSGGSDIIAIIIGAFG